MLHRRWSLTVKGRLRTTIRLWDDADEPLAELRMLARSHGVSRCTAVGRDGTEWSIGVDALGTSEARRDGHVHARVGDGTLEAGGTPLRADVAWDGARTATVVSSRGRELLRVAPGAGRGAPWAVMDVSDELPRPVPTVLAVAVRLIVADGYLRGADGAPPTGGGGA